MVFFCLFSPVLMRHDLMEGTLSVWPSGRCWLLGNRCRVSTFAWSYIIKQEAPSGTAYRNFVFDLGTRQRGESLRM